MDKRKRRRNGTEFSNSIQQSRREQNTNTMEAYKNTVSLQKRKQRKDIRKSKRDIFDEHSM